MKTTSEEAQQVFRQFANTWRESSPAPVRVGSLKPDCRAMGARDDYASQRDIVAVDLRRSRRNA